MKHLAVDYGASVLVAKPGSPVSEGDGTDAPRATLKSRVSSKPEMATKIDLGMRIPSFKVMNQADTRPWHFQELLKSNGRWRVVLFAGDVADASQMARIHALGHKLSSQQSFVKRFTPPSARYDAVIEVLTLHSAKRTDFTIFDFPEPLRPFDERDGWDYWKIFVDDESYHEGHGRAYENYGVDAGKGCAVILRPDQYVSWVGEVDDYDSMDTFFSGFMIDQGGKEKDAFTSIRKMSAINGSGA